MPLICPLLRSIAFILYIITVKQCNKNHNFKRNLNSVAITIVLRYSTANGLM